MKEIDRKNWMAVLLFKPKQGGDTVFSNFDHKYTLDENQVKKSGEFHSHCATEYCGFIWYDEDKKKFYNEIRRHRETISIIEGDTLKEVVEQAIELFGCK